MALFNKTKFDDITIENNAKYQPQATTQSSSPSRNPAPTSQPAASTPSARPSSSINSGPYGIQEAIELIRKLPNVNTDIVITVVIKTLESANISVDKIIKDAQAREHKIEDRSGRLISKIESLEAEIAELNEEITQLNSDLEETNRVKDLLMRSLNIETPASASASATSNTTPNATPKTQSPSHGDEHKSKEESSASS